MKKTLFFFISFSFYLSAIEHDGPYLKWKKQLKADQKKVDEKLQELEERFGKKPNIIYILANRTNKKTESTFGPHD